MSSSMNFRQAIDQELNKIPESQLFQVLKIIQNFSVQNHPILIEDSSTKAFNVLIGQIENTTSESFQKQLSQIEILFKEWDEVDSLAEQQDTLMIFQSLEKVHI